MSSADWRQELAPLLSLPSHPRDRKALSLEAVGMANWFFGMLP